MYVIHIQLLFFVCCFVVIVFACTYIQKYITYHIVDYFRRVNISVISIVSDENKSDNFFARVHLMHSSSWTDTVHIYRYA